MTRPRWAIYGAAVAVAVMVVLAVLRQRERDNTLLTERKALVSQVAALQAEAAKLKTQLAAADRHVETFREELEKYAVAAAELASAEPEAPNEPKGDALPLGVGMARLIWDGQMPPELELPAKWDDLESNLRAFRVELNWDVPTRNPDWYLFERDLRKGDLGLYVFPGLDAPSLRGGASE